VPRANVSRAAPVCAKRRWPRLVEHDEVYAREIVGKPALAASVGLAFEPVDEVDNDVEAVTGAAANAG
jgi:hypothetical protein